MNIVLIGSYRKHRDILFQIREEFISHGIKVLRPQTDEVIQVEGWVRLAGDPSTPTGVQQEQLRAIDRADAVYVVNPGGYIGPSGMLQCGYAHAQDIPIWFAEPPYESGAQTIGDGVLSVLQAVGQLRSH
jgi:hypothetical protein